MDSPLYERIFETTSDAVFVADVKNGEVVEANPAASDLVGRDREDIVGSHFSAFHPESEREEYERLFREFVEEGKAVREDLHLLDAEGNEIPVEYSASVLEIDGRKFLQGTIRDISHRKELEERLREQRERYRRVFTGSNDAIFIVDPERNEILDCNERACQLLGYDSDELEGLPVSEVHPDEMERFRAFADDVFEEGTGWTDELSCVTKTGERIPAIVAGSTIEWEDGTALLAAVQDISEQKRRERALDSIQQTARRLLEARSREESAAVAAEAVNDVLATSYGTVWFRENGRFVPAATTDEAATDGLPAVDDSDEFLNNAIAESDDGVVKVDPPASAADAIETVLLAPVGDEGVFTVGLTDTERSGDDPRFVEILAANVTAAIERSDKVADLQRANEELAILNRVVRHDIRNDATLLITELRQARADLEDVDTEAVDRIDRAVDDAQHIVDVTATVGDLVDIVTGEDVPDTESVDLVGTLEREIDRARSVYPEARFRLEVEAEPTVAGNEMLSSVFRNLLNNAVDHQEGPEPVVEVEVSVDGSEAEVRVVDYGSGVPDERKEDLFERGEQGLESSGIGLGLYLVDQLIEQFGGKVDVEDAPTGGAAFVVRLQRVTQSD